LILERLEGEYVLEILTLCLTKKIAVFNMQLKTAIFFVKPNAVKA